jgi:hypothetical protein
VQIVVEGGVAVVEGDETEQQEDAVAAQNTPAISSSDAPEHGFVFVAHGYTIPKAR